MQKQNNKELIKWRTIEAIIIDIIVAFIIAIIILLATKFLLNKEIKKAIEVVDMFSVKQNSNVVPEVKFSGINNTITEYPEYGTRYGNIKIDSIGVNLPLYYGDKLSILNKGIGQSSGAYFPGEGGTIICMGHNSKTFLYNLPDVKNGDKIEIETTYGKFSYEVYDAKVVNMYDVDKLPVQKDEEILMLYTCYPIRGIGHRTDRYVIYAKRVN